MTSIGLKSAARLLSEAAKKRTSVTASELSIERNDFAAAYAIQRELINMAGLPVSGWKIGAANTKQQEMFGLTEPFIGGAFHRDIFRSPARLRQDNFHMIGVECEVMFELACDIGRERGAMSDAEAAECVRGLRAGFEIFSSRVVDPFKAGAAALTADRGGNGALVITDLIEDWLGIDRSAVTATLLIDGETVGEGAGAAVLGDPFRSFCWFVNKMASLGWTAKKGDIVAAGSLTPICFVDRPASVVANFSLDQSALVEIE